MKAQVKKHSGKRKSISGKLNISILSVLIPSLVILIFVSCTIAAKSVTALSATNLNAQAENAVNRVDNFFTNKLTAISMFANNTRMQMYLQAATGPENTERYFDSADVVKQLKHMLDSMSEQGVQAAWLVGTENATYLMDDGQMVACNFEETDWDDAVYRAKKAVVSEPFLDPVTRNMVISIVSPVFSPDSQDIIGFAGFDVFQDSLGERLSQITIGKEGYLELFSNSSSYVYSQDSSVINKSVDAIGLSSDFVSKVKNHELGALEYTYDGTTYSSIIKECTSTGWLTIANQPLSEINSTRKQIIIALTLLSAVILVVLIAILWIIVNKLTKPIQVLTTGVEEFAKGHLNVEIDVQTNDEIGILSDSIRLTIATLKDLIQNISGLLSEIAKGNLTSIVEGEYIGDFLPIKEALLHIVSSLNKTLGQINESSDQVSSGADQVASGAQALSQGATEQASSIEELAATINEISTQINDSAQNAGLANDKSNAVGTEAAESSRRMQEMLDAMVEISQSSDEIGKIIKTIEDIAFQTNILALNAAVEAARAGAAGKGFAVVADEVRNLASKSAEASKNTAALIEKSLKSVEHGTKIANETAASLNTVVDGVKEVGETIKKVSSAAKDQAQSIAQVTVGVDQISSVVQTNSATAEESAAASEELSGQAQILKNLISKFQIQKEKKLLMPDSVESYIEPATDKNWDSQSKY